MLGTGHALPAAQGDELGARWTLLVAVVAIVARALVWRDLAGEILVVEPQLDAREAVEWARRVAHGDLSLPAYPTRGFLHPFVLGGLLAMSGGALAWARAAQLLMGVATAVFAGGIAARQWGRREGLATGLVVAVYAPFAFVDTYFWEEPLFAFLLVASLAQLARPDSSPARAALAGALCGAAVCVRPTALAVLAVWAVALLARRVSAARRCALAFALSGLLIALGGIAAVSRAAGFVLPIRGYGGLNLWMGNDPAGGGVQSAPVGGSWDRLEAAPFRAGVDELAAYDAWYVRSAFGRAAADPAGAARVLASKVVWLFAAEEVRDSQSFHYFRERSPTLRALPGFAPLLALVAVGVVAAVRGRGSPWLALLGAAALALAVVATVVGFRYRLPIVALVAPLAGLGATTIVGSLARRDWRRASVLLLLAATVAFASSLRRHEPSHRFTEESAQAGLSHLRVGDRSAAERAFRAAADDTSSGLGPDGLGTLARADGQLAAARAHFDEAIRRDPDLQRARLHSAELALQENRPADARRALEASYAIGPRHLPTVERLLPLVVAAGDYDRASELARRWTQLVPDRREAWLVRARIEGARSSWEAAFAACARALAIDPDWREAKLVDGFLALAANDAGRAAAAAARLPAEDRSPEARLLRAGALALAGDRRAADLALRELLRERPGDAQARALLLANAEALGERGAAERFLAER